MTKTGRFVPDATRSGRFQDLKSTAQTVSLVEKSKGQESDGDEAINSSSESSDDSSSTTDEDDTDSEAEADYGKNRALTNLSFMALRPCIEELHDDLRTWRHIQSGVQHLQEHDSEKFLCGRRVTDKYVLTDQGLLAEIAACQTCTNTKVVKEAQKTAHSMRE